MAVRATAALAFAVLLACLAGASAMARPPGAAPGANRASEALTVTSIEPAEGSEAGGTKVTIKDTGFVERATVTIGSAATAVSIVATLPPGSGKVDVTVPTAGGATATSAADAFSYVTPSPPAPPAPSPSPAAAAKCTMTPIFLTIERKHKGKARPKITAGQLRVTVTCTDNASVKLAGTLTMPIGKKPKHGKQRMRTYSLGPSTTTVAKGAETVVAVKLPLNTLVVLVAKAKESVKVTLNATSAGGSSYNGVSIKQLRV